MTARVLPRYCLLLVLASAVVRSPLAADPLPHDPRFDVPPGLQVQVDFWANVFAFYSRYQVVIHDIDHLGRVYGVVDLRPLAERGLGEVAIAVAKEKAVEREKSRIRAALRRLDRVVRTGGKPKEEDARLAELFAGDPDPEKFARAAGPDRIRSQTGLRERFGAGIAIGHRYFPEMERIFREEGVPVALTRLPLVESCFDVRAYSRVGASGIWQFMPFTGRRFLRIDDAIDQRLDPLVSTRAAARFLRENHDRLGTWPLAVTAYNHGPNGIARAVRKLGTTDIETIIERYDGRSFKFASRNFYAEFLAALEVERDHLQYFGSLPLADPLEADSFVLPSYVPIDALVACAGGDEATIRDLNPSLLRTVYEGKQRVPLGFEVWLPPGFGERFERCYRLLPAARKFDRQKPMFVLHRVRRGQTLGQIARRYGASVEAIRRRNGLRNKNLIRVGQVLEIPSG